MQARLSTRHGCTPASPIFGPSEVASDSELHILRVRRLRPSQREFSGGREATVRSMSVLGSFPLAPASPSNGQLMDAYSWVAYWTQTCNAGQLCSYVVERSSKDSFFSLPRVRIFDPTMPRPPPIALTIDFVGMARSCRKRDLARMHASVGAIPIPNCNRVNIWQHLE